MPREVIYNEIIGEEPVKEEGGLLEDPVYIKNISSPTIEKIMEDSVKDAPRTHPDNRTGKMKILSESTNG